MAALLTEEEKMAIMEKVSKLFFNRMEDFHNMSAADRDKAMREAAHNMAEEDRLNANPMGGNVDIEELDLGF